MGCVRGDVIPLFHQFTVDEGVEVTAAHVRVLHEDGDNVYEDLGWTTMKPFSDGFAVSFDTAVVDHDGAYVVVYRATLADGRQVADMDTLTVGEQPPAPLSVATVRLFGYVSSSGSGRLLGNVAVAARTQTGALAAQTVTNYTGQWAVSLAPGDYVFTFSADGHAERTVRAQVGDQEREVQFSNVALEPDNESFRGAGVHRVTDVFTDKHDLGIRGIAVTVTSAASLDDVEAQCTTDDDGRWRVHLDPGEHLMRLDLPSGSTKVFRLIVDQDGGHQLVEFRTSTVVADADGGVQEQLSNGVGEVAMHDVVTDSHGAGIQGVVVKAYLYNPETLDFDFVAGDVSTSTGEFNLNLDHGRYRMTFDGAGFKHLEQIVNV